MCNVCQCVCIQLIGSVKTLVTSQLYMVSNRYGRLSCCSVLKTNITLTLSNSVPYTVQGHLCIYAEIIKNYMNELICCTFVFFVTLHTHGPFSKKEINVNVLPIYKSSTCLYIYRYVSMIYIYIYILYIYIHIYICMDRAMDPYSPSIPICVALYCNIYIYIHRDIYIYIYTPGLVSYR